MMPVRNEAWCLGLSARVALMWCDELVILNHESQDATHLIIRGIQEEHGYGDDGGHVHYLAASGGWDEMAHRQFMLDAARERGATHLAICDADEVLTGNLLTVPGNAYYARSCIEAAPQNSITQLPLYNSRNSLTQYHSNGVWGCNRFLSVAFANDPRLYWQGDRFHSREPQGAILNPYKPIKHGEGGTLHLWGVNERRLRAKHALFKCVERLRWPNKSIQAIEAEYNLWRDPQAAGVKWPAQTAWQQPWTFADVPASWWEPYLDLMKYLDVDAIPYQEAEVQRLVAEHGKERFAGLDLFGVA